MIKSYYIISAFRVLIVQLGYIIYMSYTFIDPSGNSSAACSNLEQVACQSPKCVSMAFQQYELVHIYIFSG